MRRSVPLGAIWVLSFVGWLGCSSANDGHAAAGGGAGHAGAVGEDDGMAGTGGTGVGGGLGDGGSSPGGNSNQDRLSGDAGTGGDRSGGAGTGGDRSGGAGNGGTGGGATSDGWLYTSGNHIFRSDGTVFHGRGANLQDTRSCWACAWSPPDPEEVIRRMDALTDDWGADFIRLTLESYGAGSEEQSNGALQWGTAVEDSSYLADIKRIVDHAGEKPGLVVLLSVWVDPTIDDRGWPTEGTRTVWRTLVDTFKDSPHVMFGIVNEPESNDDGALDADVWEQMNLTVEAIRQEEELQGTPHHVITVQGTGGWARYLQYYVTHPIASFDGENIAYEVHAYDAESEFQERFVEPAATLPVVIGEFGPADGYMTLDDCSALMEQAEALEVAYLAWTFHMNCAPNLLVDNSDGGCGEQMALEPTEWGQLLVDRLAGP